MTSEEARQKVSLCERNVKSAYSGLWGYAQEVGTAGYNAVLRNKDHIEEDASRNTMIKVSLPILLIVFGFILCGKLHSGVGLLLMIVGAVLAYKMYHSAGGEAYKRSDAANATLNEVLGERSQLNSVLDKNKAI